MDIATTIDDLPVRTEYVRLPNKLATGRYDHRGSIWKGGGKQYDNDEATAGNVFIRTKGTAFIWCVFQYELLPGQRAEMIITNARGTFLAGVSFSEWNTEDNVPCLSNALFTLIASSRGGNSFRIVGRNHSDKDLPCAVGIVIADDADYKDE